MGGSFSSYEVDGIKYSQDQLLEKLWSWCEGLDNEIKAINTRINQDNHSQNTGSSADVQPLSKKIDDVSAENGRLRADITALSTKIDQNIADSIHWKSDVGALPSKFRNILGAEVDTMNAKYRALSTKVDNGFNNTPPAINRGLAIGLPLGLGIPLTIAVVFLCAMWIRRRYPYIPQHMSNEEAQNYIKIHNATRRKTLTEKVCDLFEALGLKKKQAVPEIYVMNNTPTK
ncbi:hypothetical protein N7517_003698 [Penicillium concentricum]|uniref:Uncharacterized protein n=1 Tax=Penicillium concentricum TaxID=293559 RepID=A0A9W9S462_9EURO|nr:uncharacterized protein N7517_003698 [Penicillium concentricum]KAJ5371692.1 hypothetical protein N7517_003698 [Penicillium concentricum]